MFDGVFEFIGLVFTIALTLIVGMAVGLIFREWEPSLIAGGLAGFAGWFTFLRRR